MAKFCGKCGSPLNEDGSCPKCNTDKNARKTKVNSIRKPIVSAGKDAATEKSVKLTANEKRTSKKAERKQLKKEKRATMSFGQKAKRFLLKLLALILALAIIAGSGSCALVYFNIADIPFVEKVMGWFGYEKKEQDETHFASISGKFTDEKITNADEAIKAAQNAASQLGLQTATDELTLLKEDTVGELTYYRLQQNYQGIPVYGKTIVVVADKNGEAKSITSNLIDTVSVKVNTSYQSLDPTQIINKYLNENGFRKVSNINVNALSDDDLVIYIDQNGEQFFACYLVANFEYEYGKTSINLIYDLEGNTVIDKIEQLFAAKAKCFASTQKSGSFNGLQTDNGYYMKDVDRNIFIFNADDNTFWDPDTGGLAQNVPQLLVSSDNYFGNDEENEAGFARGFDLLKGLSTAYDYYYGLYQDNGIGTLIGVYDDHVGRYNGDNAGGGIVTISSITSEALPEFTDPNENNNFAGQSGLVTFGTLLSQNIESNLDVLAHEYTHFITRKNVDWISVNDQTERGDESGAINEAYSDIFGEIIEGYYRNQEPNWENGFRIIHDPMSQGFPAKIGDKEWKEYNISQSDGSTKKEYWMKTTGTSLTDYSHGFSTIISHAAYLMHTGVNDGTALDMKQLSNLWYSTMLILPSNCSFSLLRQYMEITAEIMNYTVEQKECISLAFEKVGVESNATDAQKYDTSSEVEVFDKNGFPYDNYTIVIDGKEFAGWFKLGWVKNDFHKEIVVDSAEPYELNLPKGDYTITIIDNFSGNKTYSKSIKARENQALKDIEFATAFGFDYSVNASPELQVMDVNQSLYDNYTATIKGKSESGTAYSKTVTVDKPEVPELDLEIGKYSFLLTDNADKSKTKSFSVRVRSDAPTSMIQVKTSFGKPYGEFEKSDLPPGAKEYNGHYYYIYNLPEITTWEQAQAFCRSKNGYLATLTTREENSFAYSLLSSFNVTSAYFGLHDKGYNDWQWVNNETFSYSNWSYGEPNSYSEPYGMFYEQYVETWNDGDFGNYTSDDRAFICEWGAYEIDSEQVEETPMQRTTSGERDVVLCLDMSGSMYGDKLQQTKEAAVKFINTVLQQDASIAIVTYDGYARVLSDFSVNSEDLISKVNEISDGGNTNIEDGLVKSYNLLNYSNAKKQIIVLMSDGEPNEGKVGEELISCADSIKNEGVYIYTLGFFGGYSGQSAAQTLMERIASEGCHYEVSDADSLVFFFGDIADTINGQKYIYIRIACPVDVKVSHNGETLNSSEKKLNTRTSFGTLSFEENTAEHSGDDVDDRVKVLRLKADDDYDISIVGTGRGRMDYTIGFMDENGEYSDFRKFSNIKISKNTVIDTVAEESKNTVLKVDEDGDGKYDIKYKAGENERGKVVDYSYVLYIFATIFGVAALAIAFILIKKKRKARLNEGQMK